MLTCCQVRFSSSLSSKSAAMRYSLSSMIVWNHSPSDESQSWWCETELINRASVKNKTVNANRLITMDANFVDEILLVPKRAECRHEPTIAIVPLSYITGSGAFLIEDWVIEYILQWTVRSARGPTNLTFILGLPIYVSPIWVSFQCPHPIAHLGSHVFWTWDPIQCQSEDLDIWDSLFGIQ